MPSALIRDGRRLVPWLIAGISLAIGVAIIRPFSDVPVGFDTQASVAYFDSLMAGRRLDPALSTTPKPLITLTHGVLHIGTDWRPIVWATLLVHAAAAGLAAALGIRAAGGHVGLAAGLVVAGMPLLIEDTAFGNALPWALLGWLVAASLLIRDRPYPGVAGVALLLAALCRLETLVIVSTLGVALAWARFGPWILPGPRPVVDRRLWLAVVIPFGALPLMLLYSWRLTGDPMFWVSVSQKYSDARRQTLGVLDPREQVVWFIRRYRAVWPVVVLAFVGLAILVRRRRWGELVGLTGMGAGIAAFIVVLAARQLYAPERYAIPVDVAVVVLAAVGLGALVAAVSARVDGADVKRAAVAAAAFGGALLVVLATRAGPFDPELTRVVAETRVLNENAGRVLSLLRDAGPGRTAHDAVRWLVPSAVRPRLAVDLGVPPSELGGLSLAMVDPATTPLRPGQVVYHDERGDIPRGRYTVLEAATDISLGPVVLRPLLVDADRGIWVHEVAAP